MSSCRNIFPRRYSLKGQQGISMLMSQGHWLRAFPLSCKWMVMDSGKPMMQFVLVARKKIFKHAVDRNRCKRLMREALRLHCQELEEYCRTNGIPLKVAVFYTSPIIEEFAVVERAAKRLLAALQTNLTD